MKNESENLYDVFKKGYFKSILYLNKEGQDFSIYKKENHKKAFLVISIINEDKITVLNAETSLIDSQIFKAF